MNRPIYIASSPWFIILATIFHFVIAGAVLLINLPRWFCFGFLVVLVVYYIRIISLHGLRSHKFSVTILYQDCGKWLYELRNKKNYLGSIIKERSFCSGLVIIIYMQHFYGGRYIIIPRDSLSLHNYKKLAFCLT